jgi:hypothetical protein
MNLSSPPTGKWKVLALILRGVTLVGLVTWFILLGTVCSSPTSPDGTHSMAYNCHGSIVYINQLQHLLLTWLIPAMFVIGFVLMAIEKKRKSLNAPKA